MGHVAPETGAGTRLNAHAPSGIAAPLLDFRHPCIYHCPMAANPATVRLGVKGHCLDKACKCGKHPSPDLAGP
jgi:hypothetical protein